MIWRAPIGRAVGAGERVGVLAGRPGEMVEIYNYESLAEFPLTHDDKGLTIAIRLCTVVSRGLGFRLKPLDKAVSTTN